MAQRNGLTAVRVLAATSVLGVLVACSTSVFSGKSENQPAAPGAASASPASAGPSTDNNTNADASGAPEVRTAAATGSTTTSGGSIFTTGAFPSLTPQDQSTPGCYLPQTSGQLSQLTGSELSSECWGGSGSSSSSGGWGGGGGGGYGGGGSTASASGCGTWSSGASGGWGGGYGGGKGSQGPGSLQPLTSTASGTVTVTTATATSTGTAAGSFSISQCAWAKAAIADQKAGYMIVLDAGGAVFAQPYGTADDATTQAACEAAATALQASLGGTASCLPIPLN